MLILSLLLDKNDTVDVRIFKKIPILGYLNCFQSTVSNDTTSRFFSFIYNTNRLFTISPRDTLHK